MRAPRGADEQHRDGRGGEQRPDPRHAQRQEEVEHYPRHHRDQKGEETPLGEKHRRRAVVAAQGEHDRHDARQQIRRQYECGIGLAVGRKASATDAAAPDGVIGDERRD